MLLQLGNCATQPAEAQEAYRKVAQEHGSSPFAPAAEISLRLLQWRQQHDPQGLLRKLNELEAGIERSRQMSGHPPTASAPAGN